MTGWTFSNTNKFSLDLAINKYQHSTLIDGLAEVLQEHRKLL